MNSKYTITGFADEIDQELDTQISTIKELGMTYIEMRGVDGNNLIFHSDEKVVEIKQKLDAAGVKLSALGTPIGKIGIDEPFEPHFEEYKRAVDIAHKMDTANIRMFSFYIPANSTRSYYEEKVFKQMGRFVDYARQNDIVLLHENEKGIYGEKAPECHKLMNTFSCANFKAIFDFANFVQSDQDTIEAYNLLKDYIAYVHVKDALWSDKTVVPAGFGDGHVAKILMLLKQNGYDGFLSLEPHLFDFKGFDQLERGTGSITTDKKLSGKEAFTLAHSALVNILDAL